MCKKHFQEDKSKYNGIDLVTEIVDQFPMIEELTKESYPYYTLSRLYDYLLDCNMRKRLSELIRIAEFINEVTPKCNYEMKDALVIEMINPAYDNSKIKQLFLNYLKGEAYQLFNQQKRFFEEE